jgi:hypothetical protein
MADNYIGLRAYIVLRALDTDTHWIKPYLRQLTSTSLTLALLEASDAAC